MGTTTGAAASIGEVSLEKGLRGAIRSAREDLSGFLKGAKRAAHAVGERVIPALQPQAWRDVATTSFYGYIIGSTATMMYLIRHPVLTEAANVSQTALLVVAGFSITMSATSQAWQMHEHKKRYGTYDGEGKVDVEVVVQPSNWRLLFEGAAGTFVVTDVGSGLLQSSDHFVNTGIAAVQVASFVLTFIALHMDHRRKKVAEEQAKAHEKRHKGHSRASSA